MNDGLFTKGKHKTHTMHENSLRSWRELELGDRHRKICELLSIKGPLTDRQIQEELGFEEKNSVSPCITTLKKKEVIVEVGKTHCKKYNRTVRVNGLRGVHDIGSYT